MKECTVCKETKPLDQYYNLKASKDGKAWRCKPCDTAARKAYEKKHGDRLKSGRRNNLIRYKYGLEPEDYQRILEQQNYCCAICEGPPVATASHNQMLVVDHDHKTGKVRGLLCHKCNQGLGLFKDNTTSLEKAINYLKADIH